MKIRSTHSRAALAGVAALAALGVAGFSLIAPHSLGSEPAASTHPAAVSPGIARAIYSSTRPTATPIKHLVVIFQENVSFDHYFGTYPDAANSDGQPFYAAPHTPAVDGLTPALLSDNPNGENPQRLDPANINDLLTCDQDHGYTAEQYAFDGGKMDRFTAAGGTATTTGTSPTGQPCTSQDVMNYYDGNTTTAMWNYAQHFAMSDNFFGTDFGPSAPGAINLISGDTGNVDTAHAVRGAIGYDTVSDGVGGQTLVDDAQPYWDDCSSRDALAMNGENIGNLLNSAGLSWGWFEGGFTPNTPYTGPADTASTYNQLNEPGRATCTTVHNVGTALGGTGQWGNKTDYIPHHEPFQYYASTANPHHLAPKSLAVVGTDTATPGEFNTANHQYDMTTFNGLAEAIKAGKLPATNFPAVTFLKAPGYEDGHAGYSDPLDEQQYVVNEVNLIESLPTWSSTAIIITYDDSDGWYDQAYSGVTNPSQTVDDVLSGTGSCGSASGTPLDSEMGRCGYGPRLPFIVISPYARQNYVSSTLIDQSSIIAFIEKNWALGQIPGSFANIAGSIAGMFDFASGATLAKPLYLSPNTGQPSYPVVGAISPAKGPLAGGTSVTVNGINFSTAAGKTKFFFGSVAATSVTCSSTTTCVLVSPAAKAVGGVTLSSTVDGVASANDAQLFDYYK
jgi:phospholipase C